MKGSIKQVNKSKWKVIFDLPKKPKMKDGKIILGPTGKPVMMRNQRWYTVHGTKKDAQAKLLELNYKAARGEIVEPSSVTLSQWLAKWMELAVLPPKRAKSTYRTYDLIIKNHINPFLGEIPLQQLRSSHLQGYYQSKTLKQSSLILHHAILNSALGAAVKDELLTKNVAMQVIGKPKRSLTDVRSKCWTMEQARTFLDTAREDDPVRYMLYVLAIDTGMRKGELCGLRWTNVEDGIIHVVENLTSATITPEWGPVKNAKPRTIDMSPDTSVMLRKYKAEQLKQKFRVRDIYADYDLVFARPLGAPLSMTNLGMHMDRMIKRAGVPRIRFHDLRHTCATLLLDAGESAKVVQERLGHKTIEMTMNTYAHVLPSMQQRAATKMGEILHGS